VKPLQQAHRNSPSPGVVRLLYYSMRRTVSAKAELIVWYNLPFSRYRRAKSPLWAPRKFAISRVPLQRWLVIYRVHIWHL